MGELPDHGDDQNGWREWQHDAPENAIETRAIYACSSYQFLRDGDVVVSAEQHGEREPLDSVDQDQACEGVGETDVAQHDGPGKQAHLLGKEDAKGDNAIDPAI